MLKEEKLPKEMTSNLKSEDGRKHEVKKTILEHIYEAQLLEVDPFTAIESHEHLHQWEIWIWPAKGQVYICPKGGKHTLVNNSKDKINLIAIKGCMDYSYKELEEAFEKIGFKVAEGDLLN